jgi:hypothetical protein
MHAIGYDYRSGERLTEGYVKVMWPFEIEFDGPLLSSALWVAEFRLMGHEFRLWCKPHLRLHCLSCPFE